MLNLRFLVRFLLAFFARFRVLIFVGFLAGLLFVVVIWRVAPSLQAEKEYVGIAGRHHVEDIPYGVLSLISQGLTRIDSTGELMPGLAASWETTDDGKTWVFSLKDGAFWHDGSRVSSETIQYRFEDVKVEVPDPLTLIFTLEEPFAPFPVVVSRPTFKQGLIGAGEWKVEKLRLTSGFVEEIRLKNVQRDQKIVRFYPTEEAAKVAFQLGDIDRIEDVLDPKVFASWRNVELTETVDRGRYVGIFFNNQTDLFAGNDKKGLRQGLSYAIEDKSFGGTRAIGPLSPDSWAYNPQVKGYEYDLERAVSLIGESEEGEFLEEVELSTTPLLLPIAEKIADNWVKVGVKTNVKVVSSLPQDYQAFLGIYDIPNDPDQYSTWHSTQIAISNNVSKYENPRIDKLLEDGRLELDREERKRLYLDFQRFLLEDAPAVFLYHPISYTVARK